MTLASQHGHSMIASTVLLKFQPSPSDMVRRFCLQRSPWSCLDSESLLGCSREASATPAHMSDQRYVLGVDGGTESLRAVLFDLKGNLKGHFCTPYPTQYPQVRGGAGLMEVVVSLDLFTLRCVSCYRPWIRFPIHGLVRWNFLIWSISRSSAILLLWQFLSQCK